MINTKLVTGHDLAVRVGGCAPSLRQPLAMNKPLRRTLALILVPREFQPARSPLLSLLARPAVATSLAADLRLRYFSVMMGEFGKGGVEYREWERLVMAV